MENVDEPRVDYLRFAIDGTIKVVLSFWGPIQILGVWVLLNKFDPYTLLKQSSLALFPLELIFGYICVFLVLAHLRIFRKSPNNTVLIKEYAYLLTWFIFFEIVIMVDTYYFVCFADSYLAEAMDNFFSYYGKHEMFTCFLDATQHQNLCCGARNYTDWEQYPYGKQWPQSVADGCCKPEYFAVGCGKGLLADPDVESKIHTTGCLDGLKRFIIGDSLVTGSVLLIIALSQFMCVVYASTLFNMIKKMCGLAASKLHKMIKKD